MADSSSGPLAAVVGRWKDQHKEKQASLLKLPENLRRRGATDAEMPALLEQNPTIAWLAAVIVDDRTQLQEWMSNMMQEFLFKTERLLENQSQSQDTSTHKVRSSTENTCVSDPGAAVDPAVSAAVSEVVREEFQRHQTWAADKFKQLALLKRGCEDEAQPGFDGLLPQPAGTHAVESDTVSAPSAATEADPAAGEAASDRSSQKQSLSACASPVQAKTKAGNLHHGTSASHFGEATERVQFGSNANPVAVKHGRGLKVETQRMNRHLERMKAIHKQSSLAQWLMQFIGMSDAQWKSAKRKPQTCLIKVVEAPLFIWGTFTAILLNGIWIGYQTQEQMDGVINPEHQLDASLHHQVNLCFTIVFILELFLRLGAYRLFFFTCSERGWNLYDFAVVVSAVSELIFDTMNLNFLRTLRVIRLIRVTRVLRIIRFFQGIRYLLCALLFSASMLYWTVLFLAFLMYIFAVICMQGVTNSIDENDTTLIRRVEVYYGSLSTTMFTLMLVVTGGQPWENLMDPLRDVSPYLVPAFVVYVVVALYGILNIVTAVFVEHARELRSRDRDLAVHKEMEDSEAFGTQLREFYEVEGLYHEDTMDWDFFQSIMSEKGIQMFLQTHGIDVSDAEELFLLLDVNREGQIAVEDFIFGCQRLKGAAKAMDVVLLYDQVLQTKNRITAMTDKQHALHLDIHNNTDRINTEVGLAIQSMKEVSADFYVQLNILRQTIEKKEKGKHSTHDV